MDATRPVERIVLGTVQFGLDYGISNSGGRVSREDVVAILQLASAEGITTLDTAASYGDSESVLGALEADSAPFRINTKTIAVRTAELSDGDVASIDAGFRRSLERLKRERVACLLVHDTKDLMIPGGDRLWALLQGYRREGVAGKIGISVYDAPEIEKVMARFPAEVVQAPVNVFDQRLLADGTLARLAAKGVEIQARSIFLQGLLLMSPSEVARKLPAAVAAVTMWRSACVAAGTTPLAAALAFAVAQKHIHQLVIGVHSREQLSECLQGLERTETMRWDIFANSDLGVIDPRGWPRFS